MGGAFLLVAGGCALVGLTRFKKIKGAEKTKRSATETLAVLTRSEG